jgi:Icc-related predicted phosphoesterase
MADKLEHPERAVFNLHPPPFETQLDDAPALDGDLTVQAVLGQVQFQPVGSTAVRDIVAERQPLVGLHGHIHESSGIRRLGKKRKGLILNPGSDYSTGALNGALISLDKDRADAQLVRG